MAEKTKWSFPRKSLIDKMSTISMTNPCNNIEVFFQVWDISHHTRQWYWWSKMHTCYYGWTSGTYAHIHVLVASSIYHRPRTTGSDHVVYADQALGDKWYFWHVRWQWYGWMFNVLAYVAYSLVFLNDVIRWLGGGGERRRSEGDSVRMILEGRSLIFFVGSITPPPSEMCLPRLHKSPSSSYRLLGLLIF